MGLPAGLDRGGPTYDPDSPWWIFERLQRLVMQAPTLAPAVRGAFGRLEAQFGEEATATETDAAARLAAGDRAGALRLLRDLVNSTTTRAIMVARTLTIEIAGRAAAQADSAMQTVWADLNAAAGMPGPPRPPRV